MRRAASWTHPLHESSAPRAALTVLAPADMRPISSIVRAAASKKPATRGSSVRRGPMPRHFARFGWLALVLLSSACSGAFGAGVRDYDHGRYPDALDEL